MYLRIMTQRFKVSDPFDRILNRLFIDHFPCSKFHTYFKPIPDNAFQNFDLHFSHQLRMDLTKPLFPYNMKLGLFLFQLF